MGWRTQWSWGWGWILTSLGKTFGDSMRAAAARRRHRRTHAVPVSSFSNAPFQNPMRHGIYEQLTRRSMGAPHVAGTAALMLSPKVFPKLVSIQPQPQDHWVRHPMPLACQCKS